MATLIPPDELLGLYASGWFPMATHAGDIRCYSPDPRGIIPLDAFQIPHGARKTLRDRAWQVRVDTAFEHVIRSCAARKETWIDDLLIASYCELFRLGHAHCVEVWRGDRLAGGLYGVSLGAAFFGESMFHRVPGASKVALVSLVRMLTVGGFQLLDTQWVTPHLRGFGAIEIPRKDYLRRLVAAARKAADFPREA
jgi:leucyl/phenylalanyl-tRNA--protein transferase